MSRLLPTPACQVREQLESLREQGFAFDFAWSRALERIKWPEDTTARNEWRDLLTRDRDRVWRPAYQREGKPPKGIDALTNGVLMPEPSEFAVEQLVA